MPLHRGGAEEEAAAPGDGGAERLGRAGDRHRVSLGGEEAPPWGVGVRRACVEASGGNMVLD